MSHRKFVVSKHTCPHGSVSLCGGRGDPGWGSRDGDGIRRRNKIYYPEGSSLKWRLLSSLQLYWSGLRVPSPLFHCWMELPLTQFNVEEGGVSPQIKWQWRYSFPLSHWRVTTCQATWEGVCSLVYLYVHIVVAQVLWVNSKHITTNSDHL